MKSISTEFGSSKIIKPTFKKGIELHSWSFNNSKGHKKIKIKSPHFHNDFQIGYLKKGLLENNYRNRKILIPPTQLYVIEPHEIHSEYIVQEKEVAFNFIFVPTNLMKQANIDLFDGNKQRFHDLVIANKALNLQLIHKLQNVFNSYNNLTTELEREQRLVNFILLFTSSQIDFKEITIEKQSKKIIDKVKDYMRENIFTSITLDILSKEIGVSKFHLGRIFLEETNMTIHKYLMNLKICKARELLNNDQSIGTVALKLGFTDKSHFIKCFKRATSETPGEFRNI